MYESHQLWLIPLLPLIGAAINGLLGRQLPRKAVSAIAILSVAASFFWVFQVTQALGLSDQTHLETYGTWISSGTFQIPFQFALDRLTAIMLWIVTGVGLLIHIYATSYMEHEGGYYRFFSYLNLFMFFMLVLVLANNFLVMFVGWEGVGLCSYLLIGFYFKEKFATDAANKAFIVNRIGDFGFALAMFLVFIHFGSLTFTAVMPQAAAHQRWVLEAIALLLFVGACGKSAQIPLYVWLPDAMAGPTPVSALIHAATMVTAGVYMTARCGAIFDGAETARMVVMATGGLTAFVAATIGMTQFDIKKVFAYSTVSQLGFMFMACGAGAYSAAIFHVATHAFFKALLFLGAGSVIHALAGEQDMRHMGGLRSKIPLTFWTMCAAWVAIAGIPPFSGAQSKDAILVAVHGVNVWFYWLGVLTAGLTAFYVSRAMLMTFLGTYRGKAHPHESSAWMTMPLIVLALLSVGGGFLLKGMIMPMHDAPHEGMLELWPVLAGLVGIITGYAAYGSPNATLASSFAGALGPVYRWVNDKYRVDEAYDAMFVSPIREGSRHLLWQKLDLGVVDGVVDAVGDAARGIGDIARKMQSGAIPTYATWVVYGAILVVAAFSFMGGAK